MQVCLTFPHGWVQVLPPRVTAVSDAVSFSTRRIRRQAGPFCSLSLRLILIPHNAPCFGQGLVTVFPLSTNMGGTGRLSETAPVSCSSSCSPLGSASVGDARPPDAYWRGSASCSHRAPRALHLPHGKSSPRRPENASKEMLATVRRKGELPRLVGKAGQGGFSPREATRKAGNKEWN